MVPLRRLSQAFILLSIMVVASGCVSRPAESIAIRSVTPTEAVSLFADASAQADVVSPTGTLTILALSGGGADGAYGVGVLNGWSETGQRPRFDVVTGVSTGALMSVFAFLGPQYDALLRRLYLSPKDSDIFVKKGITGLFSDSVYDNTPLKRMIEKYITPRLVEEIAREHANGRRLYVATTNLDSSELVVWDMGLLASGGGDGRADKVQLFQKVLRASAAIPVLFPPVYIKPKRGVQLRQAHVDGGIKAPVLVSDFIFQRPAKTRKLYMIINGTLALEDNFQAVAPNLGDIASMAISGLTRELTQQVVYRGYVRAQNSGTEFNLTAIPEDVPPQTDPLKFNRDHLNRIYERGRNGVKQAGFWWKKPPTLRRYDRIARR